MGDNMDVDNIDFNSLTLYSRGFQTRKKRELCGCEKIYTIIDDSNKNKYKKIYCKRDEYWLLKDSIAYKYKKDTIISQLKKTKVRYIRYLETMFFEDTRETNDLIEYIKEFIICENSIDIKYKIMKEIDLLIMDYIDNESIKIMGTENLNY